MVLIPIRAHSKSMNIVFINGLQACV